MSIISRKDFLKLTGTSLSLLALQHFMPITAFAEEATGYTPSLGMRISEIINLKGLTPAEQKSILTQRNITYDPSIEYEKIVVEEPIASTYSTYNGVEYRFQTTYGNKPVVNERRSVLNPTIAAILDRGISIAIGLTKSYIWIPFTATGLTPSQIFVYSDPSQYASTSIYTHLTVRQCEFYQDYMWNPSAFVQKASIEDTTTTYALVNPITKRFTSQTAKKTTYRTAPNYNNNNYLLEKGYYCFIHNLPSYGELV